MDVLLDYDIPEETDAEKAVETMIARFRAGEVWHFVVSPEAKEGESVECVIISATIDGILTENLV